MPADDRFQLVPPSVLICTPLEVPEIRPADVRTTGPPVIPSSPVSAGTHVWPRSVLLYVSVAFVDVLTKIDSGLDEESTEMVNELTDGGALGPVTGVHDEPAS